MRKTHGQSRARGSSPSLAYSSWANMRSRCNNPKSTFYSYYGGRGIKCCERWATFANFYEDMGDCPDGMTLDRIDPNGNYEPGNCRWETRTAQSRNRRGNKLTAEVVASIRAEHAAGARTDDLAAKYGVTRQMIRKARKGECWAV